MGKALSKTMLCGQAGELHTGDLVYIALCCLTGGKEQGTFVISGEELNLRAMPSLR